MSAQYWIAKHVDDPFRNETVNIGIIVLKDDVYAARFFGEREDGFLDGRGYTKSFRHPAVFAQWREYWREQIDSGLVAEAVSARTANFYLDVGGDVADTGTDSAADVSAFLYGMLVSKSTQPAALFYPLAEVDEDATAPAALQGSIQDAFAELNILASERDLLVRHPIVQEKPISGRHVRHTPSFSQRNGHLSVIEYIDFNNRFVKQTRDRAGWMAYMFSDIASLEGDAEAFSLIRPAANDSGAIDYAKALIGGESRIVNWNDDNARASFLNGRQTAADSI